MHSPCATRSRVKMARLGADASKAVGIASNVRLTRMPRRRSICGLKKPTTSPAIAMPMVVALTANPIAAGGGNAARAMAGSLAWRTGQPQSGTQSGLRRSSATPRLVNAHASPWRRRSSLAPEYRSWLSLSKRGGGCDARACGGHGEVPDRHIRRRAFRCVMRSSHVMVSRILADVADIQNDGFLAEVLPPVRGAEHLGTNYRPCARSARRNCWRIPRSRPAARRSARGGRHGCARARSRRARW